MGRQATWTAGFVLTCWVFIVAALAGAARASVMDLAPLESACIADSSDARNWRAMLRFDIPEALKKATVDLAILRVLVPIDSHQERELSIEAFPITRAWSADEAAWDESWESGDGAWSERRGSISSVASDGRGAAAIDVTTIVDLWMRAGGESGGLVLVPFSAGSASALTGPPGEMTLRVWFTGERRRESSGIED